MAAAALKGTAGGGVGRVVRSGVVCRLGGGTAASDSSASGLSSARGSSSLGSVASFVLGGGGSVVVGGRALRMIRPFDHSSKVEQLSQRTTAWAGPETMGCGRGFWQW